jgi:cell wall-associated NlpC family hydrolase
MQRVTRPGLSVLLGVVVLVAGCTGVPGSSTRSSGPPASLEPTPAPTASPTPTVTPDPTPEPTPSISPVLPTPTPRPTVPPLRPGHLAYVRVAVATGWRAPGSARDLDASALANPVRMREWLAALSVAEQADLIGRADTQVLLDEPVVVREVRGSWIRVTIPDQATPLDPRGYPAWIPARQLSAAPPAETDVTATITAPTAWLRDTNGTKVLELSFGTRLPVVSWDAEAVEVALPSGGHGSIDRAAVAMASDDGPALTADAAAVIATARQFLGTRYLWAGTSGFGFDCSGLVYSVYRVHGVVLPRDSAPQSLVGRSVARSDLRAGDLVFFGTSRVHHVAIYLGDGRILESPSVGHDIREADLSVHPDYAGARRVLP